MNDAFVAGAGLGPRGSAANSCREGIDEPFCFAGASIGIGLARAHIGTVNLPKVTVPFGHGDTT